ncbi:MAG TPA: rhomboid family intramembrane serine protease [Actinomycetota bacterium]|nr:rhomboid family intramembrane serine protease [Actinomycetota bacterium]
MIPLRDTNPTRRTPWVTLAFIALNVLAFALWEGFPITGSQYSADQQRVIVCHGATPYELTNFDNPPRLRDVCPEQPFYFSLFTSMFLHANLIHIGGNMLFLWIFGNNVEDRLGHVVFLLFYLAAGVVAAYAQALIGGPGSSTPLIGASGAVAGTLGAYIVMFPHARILTAIFFFFITVVELPALIVLGLWFALQFLSGVGTFSRGVEGGVAFFAHIGGFAFGALIALIFYRRQQIYRRRVPWEH